MAMHATAGYLLVGLKGAAGASAKATRAIGKGGRRRWM
jgi:hypothetical protein